MKRTICILTALATLSISLLAPLASAGSGAAGGTLCRREDASLTGARCWEAQVIVEASSETACTPKSGASGIYECTSQITISSTTTGATPTCSWTYSEATGEMIGCNYLLVVPQHAVSTGIVKFETDQVVGMRHIEVHFCIDYMMPYTDCAMIELALHFTTENSADLGGIVDAAEEIVDFVLDHQPFATNIDP